MPDRRSAKEWAAYRRRQNTQPTPRTAIAVVIRKAVAETGQAPTNEALARLLAITPERVRHHRRMVGL